MGGGWWVQLREGMQHCMHLSPVSSQPCGGHATPHVFKLLPHLFILSYLRVLLYSLKRTSHNITNKGLGIQDPAEDMQCFMLFVPLYSSLPRFQDVRHRGF